MATMKELRETCAAFGITPGRSIAETERRIAEAVNRQGQMATADSGIIAEQPAPRMSRTARMLCDCTAICGTLARNPLVYGGDPQRHNYAIMGGWQQVLMMQGRALARQAHRDAQADAAGAAGDEGGLACEVHAGVLRVSGCGGLAAIVPPGT